MECSSAYNVTFPTQCQLDITNFITAISYPQWVRMAGTEFNTCDRTKWGKLWTDLENCSSENLTLIWGTSGCNKKKNQDGDHNGGNWHR